jgi:hypothetical protein
MRTGRLWLLTASLVIATVLECGCQKTTYYVSASPDLPGKVVLSPRQNDVIQWSGLTPNFQGPTPCSENPPSGKCTVSVPDGSYIYSCTGCVDPEVVVGPGSGSQLPTGPRRPTTAATSESIALWCDNSQVTLTPPPTPFVAQASQSVEVFWVDAGTGNQKINDPQVTPSTPMPVPCMETQIGAPPNNHCTFTAPATTTTYNYTAKSASGACGGTSAAGTIVVTIQ